MVGGHSRPASPPLGFAPRLDQHAHAAPHLAPGFGLLDLRPLVAPRSTPATPLSRLVERQAADSLLV